MAHISALNIYPVKSCRGVALERARLTPAGFEHDREWMIVRPDGRFLTQREEPRLALIQTELCNGKLLLRGPQGETLSTPIDASGDAVDVTCWKDRCAAFDLGDEVGAWLGALLGRPVRLVRFDTTQKRFSDKTWTRGVETPVRFADGFPWLLISQASLDDLNSRLPTPLPMNRFRPNIVLDRLPAYAEDHVRELRFEGMTLLPVKGCTRCAITTTDQMTGVRDGEEPLRTLKEYRASKEPKGVVFGQNLILSEESRRQLAGSHHASGHELRVGQPVEVIWNSRP